MDWVASPLFARHRRLLGAVLLFAAVVLAAGWPALSSSALSSSAAAASQVAAGAGDAAGDQSLATDSLADEHDHWSGHPFAVPHPGQSHQGQIPPVRLAMTFGDSAWNAGAADVCGAVVVTEQRIGAGVMTERLAQRWGSLQVQEVRLQI